MNHLTSLSCRLAALIALLGGLGSGCDWSGRENSGVAGADAEPSTKTGVQVIKESPEDCSKRLAEIRTLYDSIPEDLRRDDGGQETVSKRVARCRNMLELWLRSCSESRVEGAAEARFWLARLLLGLFDIYKNNLEAKKVPKESIRRYATEYLDRVASLCREFLVLAPDKHEQRGPVLDFMADVLLRNKKHAAALQVYLQVIKDHADYKEMYKTVLGASRCHMELRKPEESLKLIEEFIDKESEESSRLKLMRARWNPLLILGDFERMGDYLEETETFIRDNLQRDDISTHQRLDFLTQLIPVIYRRIVFLLFPTGKFEEARQATLNFLAEVPKLKNDAKKIKRNLAVADSYVLFANLVKVALEELAGRPLPFPGDEVVWATGRQVTADEQKGKVTVLVFRNSSDKRTLPFLQALDKFTRDNEKSMNLVWISRTTKRDMGPELAKLQDAVQKAELSHAAVGFDADVDQSKLYKRYEAPLLSGSFVVIDKDGRVVFHLLDPQWKHVGVAINVLRQYL